MEQQLDMIEEKLSQLDFDKLWPGFFPLPFALYDDNHFYLNRAVDLGLETTPIGKYFKGEVDSRFAGNTVIQLNGHYLAIWNVAFDPIDDVNRMTSLIVHEMFHGFQALKEESRFGNELIALDYPMTSENLIARTQERYALYQATMTQDRADKLAWLTAFQRIRQQRQADAEEFLNYEKGIETTEGLAEYVEFKVRRQLDPTIGFDDYRNDFLVISQKNLKIRHSSYDQGLLLALIADELVPDWKTNFFASPNYLSDYVLDQLSLPAEGNTPSIDDALVEAELNHWHELQDERFATFETNRQGEELTGEFQLMGFDPMNVTKRGQEIIHNYFLFIKHNGEDRFLQGPLKVTIGKDAFDLKKIEW